MPLLEWIICGSGIVQLVKQTVLDTVHASNTKLIAMGQMLQGFYCQSLTAKFNWSKIFVMVNLSVEAQVF